jgi:hypothetical protein
MQLDWIKNTLGKSLVQSGAESDSKRCWARLVASLQQHIATKGGLALTDSAAGAVAAAADHAAAHLIDSHSASGKGAAAGGGVFGRLTNASSLLVIVLLLLLAVLLLALVASVRSGSARVAGELHQLTAVLGAMGRQCAAPNPGMFGYMSG